MGLLYKKTYFLVVNNHLFSNQLKRQNSKYINIGRDQKELLTF